MKFKPPTERNPNRTFSYSREFAHLAERVNELDNPSRFICEAIAEKFERMDNPSGSSDSGSLSNSKTKGLTIIYNGEEIKIHL